MPDVAERPDVLTLDNFFVRGRVFVISWLQ